MFGSGRHGYGTATTTGIPRRSSSSGARAWFYRLTRGRISRSTGAAQQPRALFMERDVRVAAVVLDMDGLMLDTEPLYKYAADRQRAATVLTLAGKLRSL